MKHQLDRSPHRDAAGRHQEQCPSGAQIDGHPAPLDRRIARGPATVVEPDIEVDPLRGPTLACGTGACGTAIASALNKKTGRSVDVKIELGTLHIDWAEDNHVYMTGPAEIVFEGEIQI